MALPKRKLTETQLQQAIRLRNEGKTLKYISAELEFPVYLLTDELKVAGLAIEHGRFRPKDMDKPTYREVAAVKAYDERKPLSIIKELYGVDGLKAIKLAKRKMQKSGIM